MRLYNEPKEEYPTLCESECPAIRQPGLGVEVSVAGGRGPRTKCQVCRSVSPWVICRGGVAGRETIDDR